MARKQRKLAPVGRFGGRGMRKGLVKAIFSMDPTDLERLRREAARRMVERRAGRVDASELVREAVALWLKNNGR